MNKTYRQLVSRVLTALNANNKDTYIPRRYILSVFKSKAELLISQSFRALSMFREYGILKWINCVKFESVDVIKCGKIEFNNCEKLMKSKKKLPKLIWSKFGASLFEVVSIDRGKQFTVISEIDFMNIKKKSSYDKFKGKYVILSSDGHLYIPDSEVIALNILVFTLDEKYKECGECGECDGSEEECVDYWDTEYNVPDKLEDSIVTETLKEVAMKYNIPADNNPNLDDSQRSATV